MATKRNVEQEPVDKIVWSLMDYNIIIAKCCWLANYASYNWIWAVNEIERLQIKQNTFALKLNIEAGMWTERNQ